MWTVVRILSVVAVTSWLAPGPGADLHAASPSEQPPPPVVGVPPAAPVAWLISRGPNTIRVLIRDQSTTEDVFRIERRPAGVGAWTLVADLRIRSLTPDTGFELPYDDQPLAENAEYHYRIRAGRTPPTAGAAIWWSDSVVLSGWTRLDPGPPASQFCDRVAIDDCRATFRLSSGLHLSYYSSYPLDRVRLTITRVVLAVHGVSRKYWNTYDNMVGAVTTADVRSATLIVAPLYDEDDWGESWKQGGASSHHTIGSFMAADQLILAMTHPNVFPNVREVVVAGHSAGGQFTQRFAATSAIDSQRPGLKYRFVVANPSSYVYLNDQRPVAASSIDTDYSYVRFGTPARCPYYNHYKYGLEGRSGYVGAFTDDGVRAQYAHRYVIYLLGNLDTDINAGDLDDSCEAYLQGAQRFARGTFFYRHMMQFYPSNRHRRVVVPNVGHSGSGMFNSTNGREALFF
jgi:hypothetical protein